MLCVDTLNHSHDRHDLPGWQSGDTVQEQGLALSEQQESPEKSRKKLPESHC